MVETLPEGEGFLSLELKDAEGKVVARNFYCVPAGGGEYVWKQADWWGIPMTGYADLSFVTRLPKATVEMTTEAIEDGVLVKLENKSGVVAYQLILKAKCGCGKLKGGAIWEDNFLSLAPGETRTVLCTEKEANITLDGWNI